MAQHCREYRLVKARDAALVLADLQAEAVGRNRIALQRAPIRHLTPGRFFGTDVSILARTTVIAAPIEHICVRAGMHRLSADKRERADQTHVGDSLVHDDRSDVRAARLPAAPPLLQLLPVHRIKDALLEVEGAVRLELRAVRCQGRRVPYPALVRTSSV